MEAMDRISGLPEEIMLEILLRLPDKDGVSLKMTSTTWNSLPLSYFSFRLPNYRCYKTKSVVSFIDQSLRILHDHHQKRIVRCFKILPEWRIPPHSHHINRWLKLLSKHCLHELDLDLERSLGRYNFPLERFDFGSLISLRLSGCILERKIIPEDKRKKFHSLKDVSLYRVDFGGLEIGELLSRCPSLESLRLKYCENIKHLQILCPKLKHLVYEGEDRDRSNYTYKIEAANLETLHFEQWGHALDQLEAVNCNNLKQLILEMPTTTDVESYVNKFPLLQVLGLRVRSVWGIHADSPRLMISSHQLKEFKLFDDHSCNHIKEFALHTPNLLSCIFYHRYLHIEGQFSLESSKLEHVKILLFYGPHQANRFFLNLQMNNQERLTAIAIAGREIKLSLEGLRSEKSPMADVMHLEVILSNVVRKKAIRDKLPMKYDFSSFIDTLLWNCRPATLSLR